MEGPAYTRLPVDERRDRLRALGAELFARHSYRELSMARELLLGALAGGLRAAGAEPLLAT